MCVRVFGAVGEASVIYTNAVSGSIIRVGARSGGLGGCLLIEEYNVVLVKVIYKHPDVSRIY